MNSVTDEAKVTATSTTDETILNSQSSSPKMSLDNSTSEAMLEKKQDSKPPVCNKNTVETFSILVPLDQKASNNQEAVEVS